LSKVEAWEGEAGLLSLSPELLSLSPGLLLPEMPLGELAEDAGLLELLVEDGAPSRPATWRAASLTSTSRRGRCAGRASTRASALPTLPSSVPFTPTGPGGRPPGPL